MDKVLITGGTGFIGFWVAGYQSEKFETTVLDHNYYDRYPGWMDEKWKYIIHLAPVPIDRVLECAMKCNATVLLASSGGVYDRQPSEYFQMKMADENKLVYSRVDGKIARIFTTCGAHMKWERYAIGNFIRMAEMGGPIDVQSRGLVVRSYMYGTDLAEWLWKILLEGQSGRRYNVGSDVPHSTQELAYEVAGHYDPRPVINIISRMDYEPRPFYVPDISEARDELGLSIKVPFEEAVARTVEDYRNAR